MNVIEINDDDNSSFFVRVRVPTIIMNNTIYFFIFLNCNQHFGNFKP